LKHTKVEATNGFSVAVGECVPEGTDLISGFSVSQSLILCSLDTNSCPKVSFKLTFNEEVRAFSVHSSARFVAVALENKKVFVISLTDLDTSATEDSGRISGFKVLHSLTAPKKVTAIHWTDDATLLYSDKFGNVFAHSFVSEGDGIKAEPKEPSMPLGHYSVVTDMQVIQKKGTNVRYVVTSDKDEKIRVSRWPHSYDIVSFCLGHTQYISALCPVQKSGQLDLLISAGGDGKLFGWNYENGSKLFSYDLSHIQDEPESVTARLRAQFKATNITISNVEYEEQNNLLFVSIEFSHQIFIFHPSESDLKLLGSVNVSIVPIKLSLDPIAKTLWISGLATSPSSSQVQVYNISTQSPFLDLNISHTSQIHESTKLHMHQLSSEAAQRSFVIHSLEENLKKMQFRRVGVPHSGTYKAEPSAKKAKHSE
jgi:hypothetical protein